MPSKHDPVDSLADIIENAERIERYLAGMDRDALASNGLARDAIERCPSGCVRRRTAWATVGPS